MTRGWEDFIASVARTPAEAAAEREKPTCILCRKGGELVDGYCPGCIAWAASIITVVEKTEAPQ